MKIIYYCLFLLASSAIYATEVEKEIKYLGNDGVEESHEVVCLNGNVGIVKINNSTREMTVEVNSTSVGVNIGKSTFGVAEEMICN